MTVPDKLTGDELLAMRGGRYRKYSDADTIAGQRLWVAAWGTTIALVWAQNEENAELRVRHRAFDRRLTVQAIYRNYRGRVVDGEVKIRLATDQPPRRPRSVFHRRRSGQRGCPPQRRRPARPMGDDGCCPTRPPRPAGQEVTSLARLVLAFWTDHAPIAPPELPGEQGAQ